MFDNLVGDKRHQVDTVLYVPHFISQEAQMQRATQLINEGQKVAIHNHSSTTPCGLTDRCGLLTASETGAILVAEHDTAT